MPVMPRAVREAEERANQLMQPKAEEPAAPQDDDGDDGLDAELRFGDDHGADGDRDDGDGGDGGQPGTPAAPPAPENDAVVQELRSQNAMLLRRIEQLERSQRAPQQAPAPKVEDVTDEEREVFGDDMIAVVEKVVRRELAKFAPKIERVEQEVQRTTATTKQQASIAALENSKTGVPGWREINVSDGFREWLARDDAYSGIPRGQLLIDAYNSGNGDRVVAIFKGYLQETKAVRPDDRQRQKPKEDGRDKLSRLAAPGKARSAPVSPADAPGPETMTTDEVTRFYQDVARGKYRGREAEAAAIEAKIHRLAREGVLVE